jgi:hypothetical protein
VPLTLQMRLKRKCNIIIDPTDWHYDTAVGGDSWLSQTSVNSLPSNFIRAVKFYGRLLAGNGRRGSNYCLWPKYNNTRTSGGTDGGMRVPTVPVHSHLQHPFLCSELNRVIKSEHFVHFDKFQQNEIQNCPSQWPRRLRHELSLPARTLWLWVRIPLKACMPVCAFILCLCCPVYR